ncbi:response regulator transcription factor [Kitasatospora sp. NPDC002040]|uniref:response regulator transcription factor n=1 Tax=Kitasatospora sp. NPDC002040 TaxID=3154661 RepID=UPI00332780C7
MITLLDQPPYRPAPAHPAGTPTVSVLLADGHHLFRSGLGALLDREADLAVVAESTTAEEAAAEAARTRPTVAVLDPDLPGPGGPATAALIRDQAPATAVLLLIAVPRSADLQRAVADGVAGVLLKDVPPGALIAAVRELARGGRVYDPRLVLDVVRAPGAPLTPRELTVLGHVAEGATINEVAAALSLSPGTVRNYVSAAIAKTRGRNRCDAIRIARERGWL